MANTDMSIRFSEDKYATKNEVARELKITSVDTFWSNILLYRSNFYHYLSLKTIDKNMIVFCGCVSINSLVNNVEMKLFRVCRDIALLTPNSKQAKAIDHHFKKQILEAINEREVLNVGVDMIEGVIRNEIISAIPTNMIMINYLKALNYIKQAYVNNIDENFLFELYGNLIGKSPDEITSFYRLFEDKNPENRVLIDRYYTSAPTNLIEQMMSSLFTFIKTSTLSSTLKAAIVYFYISYIKPFASYTDEMALLMAKATLAHESFGENVVDLPLEKVFTLSKEETARIFVEVQKTRDITYFIDYIFKNLNKYCDCLFDDIANSKVVEVREDFYQADETVENSEEEETVEEDDYDIIKPVEKHLDNVVLPEENVVAPKKKTVKVAYVQEELAVSYIPVALDEKQALLLEQDLLERDPELKKGEAKFYARHCTKGKKYTIAQYKKSLRCAYETARTSMDHLVELLYYSKEKIKNKYVYIPRERE